MRLLQNIASAADRIFGLGGGDTVRARAGDDEARGGSGSDLLFGEAGDDGLFGESGDDDLRGGSGDGRLFGGDGRDRFRDQAFGPDGDDLYDGGTGRDLLEFRSPGSPGVTLTLGADGSGQAREGAEADTFRGIEVFLGGDGDDSFTGNGAANEFSGGGGNDRLFGRGGDDVLRAETSALEASAFLDGGAGDDTVVGGRGGDRILAGTGADGLNGGRDEEDNGFSEDVINMGVDADADTLTAVIDLNPVDEEFSYGFNIDRIANFRAQDRLDISINDGLDTDIFSVKGNIDSNGDGLVNKADDFVFRQEGDLVLDVRRLYEGVTDDSLGFLDRSNQFIILENVARFDVDQLV